MRRLAHDCEHIILHIRKILAFGHLLHSNILRDLQLNAIPKMIRKTLSLIAFFACSISLIAQWTNLGQQSELVMTSNQKGLSFTNTAGSTPAQGITWKVFGTVDDWVSNAQQSTGGGSGLGCCSLSNPVSLNDATVYVTHNFQGIYTILKTADAGDTWQNLSTSNMNFNVRESVLLGVDDVLVIGADYSADEAVAVRIRPQGVDTLFSSEFHNGLTARICFPSNQLGFVSVVDTSGIVRLMRTSDGGSTWANTLSVGLGDHLAIDFANAFTGYAGGSNGTFYKTTDAGLTWNSLPINGPVTSNQIEFLNADTGYVATNNGLLMRTYDGGQNWSSEVVDSAANLTYLKVVDTDIIYVQRDDYTLFKRNYVTANEDVQALSQQIKVYPQPTSSLLNIALPQGHKLEYFDLAGLDGKVLLQGHEKLLDLSAFSSGVYFLRIKTNKGTQVLKVIKD